MAKSVIRTVLVIGDNHEEIIKKYSLDTKVEPYVKMKRKDAKQMRKKHIDLLKNMLDTDLVKFNENQLEIYKNLFQDIKNMDEFTYFMNATKGCRYDEKTFDAYSTENPNAHYKYEKCYNDRLIKTGEEGPFSNPFKLKNGKLSYVAKFEDIDWDLMHMHNTEIYKAAWDIVVEGREPVTDIEKQISDNMSKRKDYFLNFKDVDEYVTHSCAFWCYGVATEDYYDELTYDILDKDWVSNFYKKYIKSIKNNPTLAIYEVRSLND